MKIAPRFRASRVSRPLPLLLILAALLTAACASQPRAADTAALPGPATKPDPDALFAPGDGTVVLAPGGDWFVDEKGRQYYLVEVARKPQYRIFSTRGGAGVMLPPGAAFELFEERGDILVVKMYYYVPPVPASAKPAAERGAAITDLETLKVTTTDRLRFTRFDRGLPRNGQWRQGFVLVDIDGDGNLDIVHGPERKGDGKPKIFLGDGAGGWRLWREARFEGQSLDYGDVAVADLDLDGALDLAFAVHLRGLVVMTGDGRGGFRRWGDELPYWTPGSGQEAPAFSSRTVEVVDWDRDGRPDLLTLGEGPRMSRPAGSSAPDFQHGDRGPILFLNRGEGRWQRHDQGTGRDRVFGDGLAVGDFDGNGLADFAVASRVSGATKLVMLGTGEIGWEEVGLGELARPGIYGSVHAADLDGDGREEILLGYTATGTAKRVWTGIDLLAYRDQTWRRTALVAEADNLAGVSALSTGDLDGDGRLDIVALTSAGERWILLAKADGTFAREASLELAPSQPGCQGYAVEVAQVGGQPVVFMGFAGEPGSEQIFPGQAKKCPGEGSLEAWAVAPR